MPGARLEITDPLGRRVVPVEKSPFAIGRSSTNDLRLSGGDISREHAEIICEGDKCLLRDRQSRYGSYVNGDAVTERWLAHGDRIRFGRAGDTEITFLLDEEGSSVESATTSAVGDLRQISALLEGLRAIGSGRVLDEVLALVIDSSIEVTGAERGFIMLADEDGRLEFKVARARGRLTLSGSRFEVSRKIPEEVFATGQARLVPDMLDGDLANVHLGTVALGIRTVLCVPLRLVRLTERAEQVTEPKLIGVLYLDSREKAALVSRAASSALETLAAEAAVAIQNARLYREALEKARIEQELKIAAKIQQALLPPGERYGEFFEASGATLPCRAIGGDFFDYLDLPSGAFGFALGDVAGKGAPAALLTAVLQGIFAAQAEFDQGPAEAMFGVNRALIRRAVESRFATVLYARLSPDGTLTYCNAGHNPPFVIGANGIRRLDKGGLILGLFDHATFEEETLKLSLGDVVVSFSDGVSEALNEAGEEFGESRLLESVKAPGVEPSKLLTRLLNAVRDFGGGASQGDDVTALIVRYTGKPS